MRNSLNMLPKQREMDGIVKQIYQSIEHKSHLQSTILVLCGDHGMNDAGNHGGSAPGETSPALVFASPKFKALSGHFECPAMPSKDFSFYDTVEQSDIVPTLASLLGIPISLNNLGIILPGFLSMWPSGRIILPFDFVCFSDRFTEAEQVRLLLRNTLQLFRIVKTTFPHPSYDDASSSITCSESPSTASEELPCAWRRVQFALSASKSSSWSMSDVGPSLMEVSVAK